jgi:hypothetical protein
MPRDKSPHQSPNFVQLGDGIGAADCNHEYVIE